LDESAHASLAASCDELRARTGNPPLGILCVLIYPATLILKDNDLGIPGIKLSMDDDPKLIRVKKAAYSIIIYTTTEYNLFHNLIGSLLAGY
jgi:hypothetical protein